MTYRVRKQVLTQKLVLQRSRGDRMLDLWRDADIAELPYPFFELVGTSDLEEMRGTRAQWERFAAQVNGRFA